MSSFVAKALLSLLPSWREFLFAFAAASLPVFGIFLVTAAHRRRDETDFNSAAKKRKNEWDGFEQVATAGQLLNLLRDEAAPRRGVPLRAELSDGVQASEGISIAGRDARSVVRQGLSSGGGGKGGATAAAAARIRARQENQHQQKHAQSQKDSSAHQQNLQCNRYRSDDDGRMTLNNNVGNLNGDFGKAKLNEVEDAKPQPVLGGKRSLSAGALAPPTTAAAAASSAGFSPCVPPSHDSSVNNTRTGPSSSADASSSSSSSSSSSRPPLLAFPPLSSSTSSLVSPPSLPLNVRSRDKQGGTALAVGLESERGPLSSSPPSSPLLPVPPNERGGVTMFQIKVELLAAKNLPAASLSGTADPYAIITCAGQKRFSSVIPGSRNPMWGEEFVFFAPSLPIMLNVSLFDWDIASLSSCLGSACVTLKARLSEGFSAWYRLGGSPGQVCLHLDVTEVEMDAERHESSSQLSAARLKRHSHTFADTCSPNESQGGVEGEGRGRGGEKAGDACMTEVRPKPSALQQTFHLPPDEVLLHTFSCALERSFLYVGRLFLSPWHVCFHSRLFSKELNIVLPYEDILQITRSSHALINPAVTIILKNGSGGHGVPPVVFHDGRVGYKFTSFWNRGRALRALERERANFWKMEERARKEDEDGRLVQQREGERERREKAKKKHLVEEDVLQTLISNFLLPCSTAEFFEAVLSDHSLYIHKLNAERGDTEYVHEDWKPSEEFTGMVKKVTYRSLCHSPMCPPTTRMTEWERFEMKEGKRELCYETIQQAHDVPFGSYFECHARWTVRAAAKEAREGDKEGRGETRVEEVDQKCFVDVRMGVKMKKFTVMAGKIRQGGISEYKTCAELMLDMAKREIALLRERTNERMKGEGGVEERAQHDSEGERRGQEEKESLSAA